MAAAVDPARCLEILADVSWEVARALPFFGHVLAAFDRVVDERVATVAVGPGVDARPVLYVNAKFFTRSLRTMESRAAVLEHEVLHVVFGHLRLDEARMPDAWRRNIAADLVVNQYVVHRLPSTAVTIKGFAWMPPDLTCEGYYDRLKAMSDEELAATVSDRACGHERWGDDDEGPSGGRFKDLIDGVREEALARAERDGTIDQISVAMREIIARARRTPRSDPFWKRALRIFCARTLRASVRPTTQRESRRYGSARARWDGPIVPGLRRGRSPAVLIAVDTSGSISNATLTTFFAQVTRIAATGARIHVVECDLAVQRDYPWDGKAPNEVKGRGGTAFDPVFAWLRGAGRKLHLTGCVYLTDGEAARPTIRPPCPLLWVITPNGTHGNVDFGRAVTMPA